MSSFERVEDDLVIPIVEERPVISKDEFTNLSNVTSRCASCTPTCNEADYSSTALEVCHAPRPYRHVQLPWIRAGGH